MGLRAKDFSSTKGFDSVYLNSQEDVDFCLRLLELPNRQTCLSIPSTTLMHSESKAPGRFCHTYWSRGWFTRTHHCQTNPVHTRMTVTMPYTQQF